MVFVVVVLCSALFQNTRLHLCVFAFAHSECVARLYSGCMCVMVQCGRQCYVGGNYSLYREHVIEDDARFCEFILSEAEIN